MGTKNESRFKLNQLVGREGFKFRYEYDFGDGWLHDLMVEKIKPVEKGVYYPICVAGKNACPPEDVGGIGGYANFLEAMADPRHPEHREYKEWIGGKFDSERFDLNGVNDGLRYPSRREEPDEQDFYEPDQSGEQILANIATWVGGLDKEQIDLIELLAVRRDMVTFLSYLDGNRVVGTQSTGNLPLKAVREICAQFVNPPVLDEKLGDRVYKLRSEEDVWQLFYLHMLANAGGLVTGGQARVWKVTPSGNSFLTAPAPIQLGFMFDVWWHYEDWRIAFPVSGLSGGLPSDFNKITLKRLLELPVGKLISYEPFADQLIKETHFTWPSLDQTFVNNTMRSAIERMVILPLVQFGVMESEYGMKDIGDSKFSKLSAIRLTPFGKGLLETL
jgi:hypothetical protein